jgi:hypothetical protein
VVLESLVNFFWGNVQRFYLYTVFPNSFENFTIWQNHDPCATALAILPLAREDTPVSPYVFSKTILQSTFILALVGAAVIPLKHSFSRLFALFEISFIDFLSLTESHSTKAMHLSFEELSIIDVSIGETNVPSTGLEAIYKHALVECPIGVALLPEPVKFIISKLASIAVPTTLPKFTSAPHSTPLELALINFPIVFRQRSLTIVKSIDEVAYVQGLIRVLYHSITL